MALEEVTRQELVQRASQLTPDSTQVIDWVLQSFMDEIQSSLSRNEKVSLRHFGTFKIKERKPKRVRDFQNGTFHQSPPSKTIAFVPSGSFKKIVRESSGQ